MFMDAEANSGQVHWPNDPRQAKFLDMLLKEMEPFDVVDDDFEYVDGLKIGLVFLDTEEARDEANSFFGRLTTMVGEAASSITNKALALLGYDDDRVKIYTGTLTGQGKDHIDYEVKTKKGCSGGAIVVMDRQHKDFGKVIAIHAGYSHKLNRNVGFKLAGNFDRRWDI